MRTKRLKLSQDSIRLLDELGDLFTLNDLRSVAGVMASHITDEATKEAPLGPTGNLKYGLTAKVNLKIKNRPAAYSSEHARLAPHSHLIEHGTKAKRPSIKSGGSYVRGIRLVKIKKTGRREPARFAYFKDKETGKMVGRWVTTTGKLPKNPFWKRSLRRSLPMAFILADIQMKKIAANKMKELDRKYK